MKTLLYIRIEQLKQVFLRGGLKKRIFLILTMMYVFVALPLILIKSPLAYFPLPGLLILTLSLVRGDAELLKKMGTLPVGVYIIEYMIISAPFLIIATVYGHWQSLVAFLMLILFLALASGLKVLRPLRKINF